MLQLINAAFGNNFRIFGPLAVRCVDLGRRFWLCCSSFELQKPERQISFPFIQGENHISKYNTLWAYIHENGDPQLTLTFDEIGQIAGVPLDHSFLKYKKELCNYGYEVTKI